MTPPESIVAQESGETVHLCSWMVRTLFNRGQYVERARRGELTVDRRERPAARTGPVPAGRTPLPPGSKSYTFIYRDKVTNRVIARAHQPRYPSGKPIPGSENQDPIYLYGGFLDKPREKPRRHVHLERGHEDSRRCGPECWMWRDIAQGEARPS